LLPLIFKNVAAVGFLVTADPRDKTIVDDKCNKLAWIKLGSGSWMYKSLGFVVESLLATPSESPVYFLGSLLGPGALNIYLGPLGLVPAIIANIRNAVYSQQTQDDIVNNILLMQIITMIRVGYLETTENFEDKSPDKIFIDALTNVIKQLSFYSRIQTTIPKETQVTLSDDISMDSVKKQKAIENIDNMLVNVSIPMQSFYYALSVVKSTYNKKTGDMLMKYYDNKDKFLEEYKNELK
ncbi:MAG: hypothetical protein MUP82_06220, partial [Candidatus Marinimicrobia bacterium]|nr:hypothetical protein [Candidatus Neomarinimicrobiota bacterium]